MRERPIGNSYLDFSNLFVLSDGSIIHTHFTGVLRLVELNYSTRSLLNGNAADFKLILAHKSKRPVECTYNIIDDLLLLNRLQH